MSREDCLLLIAGADPVKDRKIDPQKLQPISFDPVHNDYLVLGKKIGNAFEDGKKLK